jgi:hypothetical protein
MPWQPQPIVEFRLLNRGGGTQERPVALDLGECHSVLGRNRRTGAIEMRWIAVPNLGLLRDQLRDALLERIGELPHGFGIDQLNERINA